MSSIHLLNTHCGPHIVLFIFVLFKRGILLSEGNFLNEYLGSSKRVMGIEEISVTKLIYVKAIHVDEFHKDDHSQISSLSMNIILLTQHPSFVLVHTTPYI